MFCKKCKAEIPDGSAYCNLCGTRQTAKTQNRKSRGNGTGSVYQLPNKTWIARVTLGYTAKPGGGKQKHTRSKAGFKTKRDAVNYLPKLLAEPERRKDITLKAAFDTWIPDHEAGKSTINNYKACTNYFKPLWFVKLRDIGIDDLQECIDDCGKSRSSQEKARACISLTYKWALPRHYVPHGLNLAEYLKVGGSSGEKPGLPLDAVRRIRANAGKVSGADLVLCQCLLGFRPSEMLILTVSDYDPVHRLFVGGMKTEKGRNRSVTVSPIIQPYVDRLVSGKAPEDAVFTLSGQPMSIAAYRDLFYSVLDACGIDNPVKVVDGVEYHTYTPHSCRHTFATLMKRVDGSDKDKLELIGHTSTEMLRHYQDVDAEDLRRITDQFTL